MFDEENRFAATEQPTAEKEMLTSLYFPITSSHFGSLSIRPEAFNKAMSIELPEEMVKSIRGADYLNIAHALYLLKQNFPTLSINYVRQSTDHAGPYFDVDAEDERGTLIGVYLMESITGAKTAIHWFPVMTTAKGQMKPADPLPDSRKISDNMARAAVKAIAYFTGIGFSLYSRIDAEDLILSEGGTIPWEDEDKEDDDDEPKRKPKGKTTKNTRGSNDKYEDDDDDYEDDDEYDDDEDDDDEEESKPSRRSSSRARDLMPRRTFRR